MVTKNFKLIFTTIAIIAVLTTLFLSGTFKSNKNEPVYVGNDIASTTDKISNADYKIEVLPPDDEKKPVAKIPDLDYPVKFPEDMTAEVRSIFSQNISESRRSLKDNPNDSNEWLSLGINLKIIKDYEGARVSWEYAAKLSPSLAVIFSNLGDLYGYYLKDKTKAEENFKKAIALDSAFPNYYIKTADFYREVEHDYPKAKLTIESGLKAIPNDPNLKRALEEIKALIGP